jgi:glucose/arabinose dehydrogenase
MSYERVCAIHVLYQWALPRRGLAVLLGFCVVSAIASRSVAAVQGLERVASGLLNPIFITHPPGDASRLFIVQRAGAVRILDLNSSTLLPTPFVTIPEVERPGEGGFLGMAFDPNYAENGHFYTYSTHENGGMDVGGATSPFSTHVRRWTVSTDPNVANETFETVLSFPRPANNHVGGWIGFSPNDGYLYIASGDGGGSDDNDAGHTPGVGNAQDITDNWFGKMLRINVDGDDFPSDPDRNYAIPATNPFVNAEGDDEIWAYGLRNPFRASFDRLTGDLWIGDVGQSTREEINFQPGASSGGENYGWRLREGTIATPTGNVGGPAPPGAVDPVYDYDRDNDPYGGSVVTGGYVYRGSDVDLQGKYFFLDSRNSPSVSDDNYWMFDPSDPDATVMNIDSLVAPDEGTAQFPVSFGEDAQGNLYIAYIISGEVFRLVTDPAPSGDFDGDGDVDGDDLASWEGGFGTQSGANLSQGDADGDGDVDGTDLMQWQRTVTPAPASRPVPEPASPASLLAVACALAIGARRRSPRELESPANLDKTSPERGPRICLRRPYGFVR